MQWTESVGVTLISRDRTSMTVRLPNFAEVTFDILAIFPFSSESKRMGIVTRDRRTGQLTFVQKGADVIMAKIVAKNDWLEEETGNMAREGLRTLVLGRKKLTQDAYDDFDKRYKQAQLVSGDGRATAMQAVLTDCLEVDLELLALTGVEDKLQDDVKSTLELLRNAGLKIWMLTGDKIETATNIAVSSKLVARNQYIHQVAKRKSSLPQYFRCMGLQLRSDSQDARSGPRYAGLSIGKARLLSGHRWRITAGELFVSCRFDRTPSSCLQLCLDRFRTEFVMLATQLPAVVACRCSPTQKADVARLIREYTKKTVCCIGDGGNDVSMIQAADVGKSIPASSVSANGTLTLPGRSRYRGQRGQTGISSSRLLNQPVLVPHQTPTVARTKLVQAVCQAIAIRHSPRSDYRRHPGCIQLNLLLCSYVSSRSCTGLSKLTFQRSRCTKAGYRSAMPPCTPWRLFSRSFWTRMSTRIWPCCTRSSTRS